MLLVVNHAELLRKAEEIPNLDCLQNIAKLHSGQLVVVAPSGVIVSIPSPNMFSNKFALALEHTMLGG